MHNLLSNFEPNFLSDQLTKFKSKLLALKGFGKKQLLEPEVCISKTDLF